VPLPLPFNVIGQVLRFELSPLADQYVVQPAVVNLVDQGGSADAETIACLALADQ
jgi:hypothetical protein